MEADQTDHGVEEKMRDATLRQTIKLSVGGRAMRLRLSNLKGTGPLVIDDIHVAIAPKSGSPHIEAGTDHIVLFGGLQSISIPAGADYASDPIPLSVDAQQTVSVSFHLPERPDRVTSHPGSRTGSYIVPGDHAGDPTLAGERVEHWYFLSGVDVRGPARVIVALGDSITDGHGATTDADARWTDILSRRLSAASGLAVVNEGIGGNRVLRDGLGPNALARLDRDVLAIPGARFVLLLEGVNDLGVLTRDRVALPAEHDRLVIDLEQGYRQIVQRAHDHGLKAIGATIMPYAGSSYYHPDARNEADRLSVNRWIRTSGTFDAVVDFDAIMRDRDHPEQLAPAYDSGDGLHPSAAGYARMGEAIPLVLFR